MRIQRICKTANLALKVCISQLTIVQIFKFFRFFLSTLKWIKPKNPSHATVPLKRGGGGVTPVTCCWIYRDSALARPLCLSLSAEDRSPLRGGHGGGGGSLFLKWPPHFLISKCTKRFVTLNLNGDQLRMGRGCEGTSCFLCPIIVLSGFRVIYMF